MGLGSCERLRAYAEAARQGGRRGKRLCGTQGASSEGLWRAVSGPFLDVFDGFLMCFHGFREVFRIFQAFFGSGRAPIGHKKVPKKINIQEEFQNEGCEITTAMIRCRARCVRCFRRPFRSAGTCRTSLIGSNSWSDWMSWGFKACTTSFTFRCLPVLYARKVLMWAQDEPSYQDECGVCLCELRELQRLQVELGRAVEPPEV